MLKLLQYSVGPNKTLSSTQICEVKSQFNTAGGSEFQVRGAAVLNSLELLNGAGWSAEQHRVAVIDGK